MNDAARRVVEHLGLEPHPEGGFFRETWRSERILELGDYPGPRNAGTSILFLLPLGVESANHRVRSDELWFWQGGDPLDLRIGEDEVTIGPANPQAVVPAGEWQSAKPTDGDAGYTLVGCVVVPGFDFADFEMQSR